MSAEAWLLHKENKGESSLGLWLWTREQGVIYCLYKGGHSSKKLHILQPFLPLWVSFNHKHHYAYVRSLEQASAPLLLHSHRLFAAMYVNELLYHAVKPSDPFPVVYDRYQYTLHGLSVSDERLALEVLLRQFEWTLLKECGYPLSIASAKAHPSFPYYQFVQGRGFVSAEQGLAYDDVLALCKGDFTQASLLPMAKLIMRLAIDELLSGRPLASRLLFKSQAKLNK